eukprot:COSAG06_NODE_19254_length_846_cov_1.452477_2_plen_85_part_01
MQVLTDEEDDSTLLEQLRLAMVRKSSILYAPFSRMENSHLSRQAQDKKSQHGYCPQGSEAEEVAAEAGSSPDRIQQQQQQQQEEG